MSMPLIGLYMRLCCQQPSLWHRRLLPPVGASAHGPHKLHNLLISLSRCFVTRPERVCRNLQDIADYIKTANVNEIIVMAGAGISTPSGLPDFRTPGTGLYDNLAKYNLPYAEAVFDIDFFKMDPRPFFCLAKELYDPKRFRPNIAHYFVRLLNDKGLLLRMYTQNIDGLERLAGIPENRLIEAHGSFASATCRGCGKVFTGAHIKDKIERTEIPICKKCGGIIKPDVVFFGEQLPATFYQHHLDMPTTDLLIVMGTSLQVYPFAGIAELTPNGVPRVLFNMDPTGPFTEAARTHDLIAQGDIVQKLKEFVKVLGWEKELENLMKKSEN